MSSNTRRRRAGALSILLASVLPLATQAQSVDGSGAASVGERFESVVGTRPSTRDGLSALVTGYEDLILLEKRKFFTASASLTPQYTSNAALTPEDEGDFLAVANLGLRATTTLAERVNVHAGVGVVSAAYQDFDELDYSAVTASFGADVPFATPVGTLSIGADYAPALIYEDDFSNRQQTRHRIEGSVQLYSPLGDLAPASESRFTQALALVPTLIIERVITDPSEYEYTGASLDVALLYRPASAWQFGVSVGAYVRDYDDYFEGVVGTSRRDDGFRGGVFAQWVPAQWVAVSFGADYTDNDSTSDVNKYDSGSVTPGATFSMRF